MMGHTARKYARCLRRLAACAAALSVLCLVSLVHAEGVKGEVRITTDGGYARILIRLDEAVDTSVRVTGAIMVVTFQTPIDVSVDKLNSGAPDYISAARSDPDGRAIRIALARKVKVNTIPAGERTYIDILPDDWAGLMPGLPQEVIDELARRTREAERAVNAQRIAKLRNAGPVRVKVGTQPTFTRYVFDLSGGTNLVPERADDTLTLNFDQPVKVDLGDVKPTLPSTVQSVETAIDGGAATVTFRFNGTPKVRSFREDKTFVVDVDTEAASAAAAPAPTEPKVAEASKEAAKEPAKESAKEAAKEPAKDALKELAKDAAKEPAKEANKDAAIKGPAIEAPETVPAAAAHADPVAKPVAKTAPPPTLAPPPVAAAPKLSELPKPAAPAAEAQQIREPPHAPVHDSMQELVQEAIREPMPLEAAKPAAPKAEPNSEQRAEQKPIEAKPEPVVAAAPESSETKPSVTAPSERAEGALTVALHKIGNGFRLDFPFAAQTSAAAFRRGDVLWLVFDSTAKFDIAALTSDSDRPFKAATIIRSEDGATAVRIKLDRPRLVSFSPEGPGWVVMVADTVTDPSQPLQVARTVIGKNRSNIVVSFQNPRMLHRIQDPDVGDTLMVVTGLAPPRGFLKSQDFVELKALASTHGVVVQPLADDITADLSADKVVISRPGGLMLTTSGLSERENTNITGPVTFDSQTWGFDREAKFNVRQSELIWKAASAAEGKRRPARLNLARFYMARDMIPEAKAVLDVVLSEERSGDDTSAAVLRAVANVLMGRSEEALKDLASPQIASQNEVPLWRGVALARQGSWPEAREAFKNTETVVATLPLELQRVVTMEMARAAIEVRDFSAAAKTLNEFETMGIPRELEPEMALLNGRLNEGLGRGEDALAAYRRAAESPDRKAASQGHLRELVLGSALGSVDRKKMVEELETLTTSWRGDETEGEGLKLLAHLYTEDNRYRDAFHTMRTALLAHPNTDLTRKIQDEAAATFDSLFLSGKGDDMPAIEALGLFYDYRELTPIGRRGDEMIRKLVDRLVAVDLIDQACELLQHQVDNRLQGAARTQVATRLATLYLMNRKPDRALAVLRGSRMSDVPNDLREQRMLLEARALSDIGRYDFALEVISTLDVPQAKRLRSDVLWAAKRWREAGEQIEGFYGERWKEFEPLTADERSDILRSAIGYALGDDAMGLARLREKYTPKMAEGPDRHAFEVITAPIGTGGAEFRQAVSAAASINTLDAFLREMQNRYQDKPVADGKPDTRAELKAPPLPPRAPAGTPVRPDPTTTGSITRKPAQRQQTR